jgi:sialate O-acetylesterase
MKLPINLLAVVFVAALAQAASAQLRLASVFGDHMVLQRDQDVQIWGQGAPGKAVMVTFAGQTSKAKVRDDGRWLATLNAMPAEAVGATLRVQSGSDQAQIADVLVGDVWLCGGQSNMEWTLRGSRDADLEIDSADTPGIRFLRMPKVARAEPQDDFLKEGNSKPVGNWRSCVPEQVENCTAVGYYFARRLHRRLKVPIGIVDSSWGGTMAQHWCTKPTLETIDAVAPYFSTYDEKLAEWVGSGGAEAAKERFTKDVLDWESARDAAKADGKRAPRRPNRTNYENPANQQHPGALFNGLIAPLRQLSLRGVIFYQGENNSFGESWKPFPKTFPALIRDWRTAFSDQQLPIGLVQIAGWSSRRSMHYDMNHHTNIVREVQFDTWQSMDQVGLIVSYDTNTSQSIHPARKLPVGERLARWALAEVYKVQGRGQRGIVQWRGPVYKGMRIDGGKIVVQFDPETAKGLRLDRDVDVGFYVAGEDKKFHHASARVLGKSMEVEIWCDEVPSPVAARYGWSNLPSGGLLNGRELPAYPFRTDSWPMVPHQSKGAYHR